MGKILVPVDGSDFMERVISEACELGERYQLDLILFNAQTMSQYPSIYISTELREAEEDRMIKISEKILKVAKDLATQYLQTAKVYTEYAIGNPADKILACADKHEVDLIVIGSKGTSDIKRFLLGNVATKVVTHSHQSVLVVK